MPTNARFDEAVFDDSYFDTFFYTDNISSTDLYQDFFLFLLHLSESLSVSDTLLPFSIKKALTDPMTINEGFFKQISTNLIDNTNLTESYANDVLKLKSFSESISSVDFYNISFSKYFEDISDISDKDLAFSWGKIIFSETLSVIDTICSKPQFKFVEDVKQDFLTTLYDIMVEQMNLIKQETTYDSLGEIKEVNNKTLCIKGRIVPTSAKDRQALGIGWVETGIVTGYFLPEYKIKDETYSVELGDVIEYANNKYRIDQIYPEYLNNQLIYIKAILKKI